MARIKFNAGHNEGGTVYSVGDTCELTEQTRRFVDLNLAEVIADEAPAAASVKPSVMAEDTEH